jgi:hypothetical protein
MLSYKEYKKLNESLGSMPIGFGQKPALGGVVGSLTQTEQELEEGKKCSKKKMDVDMDDEDAAKAGVKVDLEKPEEEPEEPEAGEEGEEEEGEGEVEKKLGKEPMEKKPEEEPEDKVPMFQKKKSKKNMTAEETEWWSSIENMMFSEPYQTYWDGFKTLE